MLGGGRDVGLKKNKVLVRRFYKEVWDNGNVEFAERVFREDYVRHDLRPTTAASGAAGQARIAADFRRAFPDLRFAVDLVVGEDDLVVARWTASGTNTGLWGEVEPTGTRATFSGVNIFRFKKGKVAEVWNHRDDLGLMEQVGTHIHGGAVKGGDTRS